MSARCRPCATPGRCTLCWPVHRAPTDQSTYHRRTIPTQSEWEDQRLILSYEARIESLERQLQAEREAHGESRRIIAGLVQRIPELEAPPQSAQEAQDVAESASEGRE